MKNRQPTQRGISLIELLVSLVITSLLTLVLGNVFSGNQRARYTQERISEIQQNGRFATLWLQHDIRMSGNTAFSYQRAPIKRTEAAALAPVIVNNCFTTATQAFDWALAVLPRATGDPAPMIYGVDNVATTNTVFSGCITGADLQAGSDLISIHYTQESEVADASLVNGNLYMNSGLGGGVLFKCNVAGVACKNNLTDKRDDATGNYNHGLVSRVYWVRSFGNTAGDGIPTLMRSSLQPNGTVSSEILMLGVNSMQATYGVDTDNDGSPDIYRTAAQMPALTSIAGLSNWSKVKTVRLSMLMQSTSQDFTQDVTTITYDVGGTDISLSARWIGKVFSTTVAVRNPSARSWT